MANNIIRRVWNQNRMVNIEDLYGAAFQAEIGGHTFEISGIDDTGAAVELSGTVSGVFRRPDNADIALTGSASDGVVSVTLSEDCYAVPGRFGLTIFVTSNSQKVAVYACVGTVAVSSTGNVAGDTPANVEDLIDDINAAIADLNSAIGQIPASYANVMAAIAPTYSGSALYSVGSYAWYNGSLYRCTTAITTAEVWTAAHWTAAVLGDDVGDLKSALSDYQNAISEYKKPTNLYNKNSNLNHNDVKVSSSGNFNTLSGSSVSHPIKIDKTKSYVFKFSTSFYGTAANRIVRRCDANGNLVDLDAGFLNAEIVDNAYGRINASLWESRPQWEYFCVNVRTADKGVMIIAEGDTLPAYSDYFDPYLVILESALPPEIPLPANAENNPLYGKKLSVDGDSIMYGAGYTGGFAKIIAQNNSMPVQNIAKTGATLATGTTAEGVNRQWICTHIANIASDADYILFDGGVNDAALSVPLGTLTSGYTDTLDTSTVIGALETACKTLQTTYAGKKYGFVFPHDCYNWSNSFTTRWKPAMKECLKKWGVPFIDLGELTGQLNNISALRQYTHNSDGWHPTEEGYRLFYVDKITAWMKTL